MTTEEYAKIVSKNLKRIAYEKGKSQVQIARDLGINQATLSAWMNGTRTPKWKRNGNKKRDAIFQTSPIQKEGKSPPVKVAY